ncbi:MAG: radical SAM protein [bacterium]|nr:radical SAM protein [bacterium]
MKIKLIAASNKKSGISNFWEMGTFAKLTNKRYSQISLALPTLAALTPSGIDVEICDENIEHIDFDEKVDLVGITTNTYTVNRAYEIADTYRKRNVTVVLGGIHTSVLPEEALQHADSVVIGEAEEVWGELLNDFKENNLKKTYSSNSKPKLENSPIPRWDLVKTDSYTYHTIQTTRGCPFDCDFCSVKLFFGKEYRYKPIANIIKEIELLLKIKKNKIFFFSDDNITANKKYARELFEALIPYNIHWVGQAAVDVGIDSELLDIMYKSGCRQLLLGFESLSEKNLEQVNKPKINKVENYSKIIDNIHNNKISIIGAFILGDDSADESSFEKIKDFIEDNSIAFPQITVLTPFPGTRLYKRLKDEGRILNEDWNNYSCGVVCFKPKLISNEALQKGYIWLMRELYSYKSINKRFGSLWDKGILVKKNGNKRKIFTKNGFSLFLKSLLSQDWESNKILWKGLINKKEPSLSSLLGTISLHNYAKKLKF